MMLNNLDPVQYVIYVNNRPVSPRYPSAQIAEDSICMLSEADRQVAVVRPVDDRGNGLLLG